MIYMYFCQKGKNNGGQRACPEEYLKSEKISSFAALTGEPNGNGSLPLFLVIWVSHCKGFFNERFCRRHVCRLNGTAAKPLVNQFTLMNLKQSVVIFIWCYSPVHRWLFKNGLGTNHRSAGSFSRSFVDRWPLVRLSSLPFTWNNFQLTVLIKVRKFF